VFAYNSFPSGRTYYAVMLRNTSVESGIGLYKVTAGSATATALVRATTGAVGFINNAGTIATMNANGARAWTRVFVSRVGARIQVWLGSMAGTALLDFTDSDPLPPGNVGVHTIGTPAVVFDNAALFTTPSCSDGIHNGDEEGIDCGGWCATACTWPVDWAHDFTVQGHAGWTHDTYGDNPNGNFFGQAFVYTPGQDGVRMPTNANGMLPGSVGGNSAGWIGSWWLIPTHQPPTVDVDFAVELFPKDNDWIGLTWRFVDRDNFYAFNLRTEGGSGVPKFTIQRRRAGVNTILWATSLADLPAGVTGNPSCPDAAGTYSRTPYHQCTRQFWRVRHVGSRIEVYLPDWTTLATLTTSAASVSTLRLTAVAMDSDPLLAAGRAGVISTSHDGTIVYGVTIRSLEPVRQVAPQLAALPPAAAAALVLGVDASTACTPRRSSSVPLPPPPSSRSAGAGPPSASSRRTSSTPRPAPTRSRGRGV
jgi:hypothetical protein